MLRLFVSRHGQTIWNTQKRMQGWKDSPLTDLGIRNAIELGNRLNQVEFQGVYSSPLRRTVDTADLIIRGRQIPIVTDENLREMNMGDWEGQVQEDIKKEDPELFHKFWNKPHLYIPESGEAFIDVQRRALLAIERIQREQHSGNVLVVTHTIVIKSLLAYYKQIGIENLWDPPFIHDTSLTLIEVDHNGSQIVFEGDSTHRSIPNEKVTK
ncbi:phosphoserine phosphatase 1 [Bacillus carboniphilus]|uniref:Phosphoserine phosphatase 1 n=1 Tax=Bacillus carboniphilus TaxID=86663 RepID=A0ABN0W9G7_9BACI